MKKQVLAIITAILICGSFTACNKQDSESDLPSAQNSITDSVPDKSDDNSSMENENSSDNSTAESNSESEPIEKVRGIYGETEIPVVDVSGDLYFQRHNKYLDTMVFETHELGDYKISLVGKGVWRDMETNDICADYLDVEVEKNGVKLNGVGRESYMHEVFLGVPQYITHTVMEDKIGSYLDVYDMDVPVIVMKYYFDYDIPNSVNKAMMFATVQENELWSHFPGICAEGTSLFVGSLESPQNYRTYYYTMDDGDGNSTMHPFGEGKFKVADGKTLIDEDEGIKYTFDFSDPMLAERYTAEKIV